MEDEQFIKTIINLSRIINMLFRESYYNLQDYNFVPQWLDCADFPELRSEFSELKSEICETRESLSNISNNIAGIARTLKYGCF